MEEGRSDDGRFTPEHTDGEILAAVRAHEPAATSEVAGELDMTRQGADRRLRQLREAGRVKSKKIGASLVWFGAGGNGEEERVSDVTASPEAEAGSGRSSTPSSARDAPPGERPDATGETVDGERDTPPEAPKSSPVETTAEDTPTGRDTPAFAAVVDEIAEDTLPGSGAKLEARREALHAAVTYLRERGQATPENFRTDVYPEHTGHYTDGADPAHSWWKNCIYKGLRELAERTAVVAKADTTGEWSWKGE